MRKAVLASRRRINQSTRKQNSTMANFAKSPQAVASLGTQQRRVFGFQPHKHA
ncbi:hypothetical protein [Bradyrhizobium lablabi]|uniref:hypothetical protein n=1 Tax=Bradyrhizobium lablabi TaxID=722472 RepID=UPI000A79C339|nr:hypothetical protein [Bradyrhizobium lablabi]